MEMRVLGIIVVSNVNQLYDSEVATRWLMLLGIDTSNSSKVIAFWNIGLLKLKMAVDNSNGGLFWRRLAGRILLSRGIFVPKGMFVAFVVSSQLTTHFVTSRHTYILTYIHPTIANADSFIMNLQKMQDGRKVEQSETLTCLRDIALMMWLWIETRVVSVEWCYVVGKVWEL
jgi:hypothetical protein